MLVSHTYVQLCLYPSVVCFGNTSVTIIPYIHVMIDIFTRLTITSGGTKTVRINISTESPQNSINACISSSA